MTSVIQWKRLGLAAVLLAAGTVRAASADPVWSSLKHKAHELPDPLAERTVWEGKDVSYVQSAQSPGLLVRMRSSRIQFFSGLDRYGAEPPAIFWVKTKAGTKAFVRGQSIPGSAMTASWIVASFQGSRGWEQFDVPWFLSLEKRPAHIALSSQGLRIDFAARDTGYIFSMPLYGYCKLPQKGNDFAAKYNLPAAGLDPWKWMGELPPQVAKRCDWWAGVAKAYPVGFQENFSVDPGNDTITFRQDYRWLTVKDDWNTKPRRFAALSPSVGLAWKFPGFPMKFSAPVYDPDYFTAFGPFVGALDVDRLEISMHVLQYVDELESITEPPAPDAREREALKLISGGLRSKFPSSWQYFYDHGSRENFCWNIVADVWYSRALPFVSGAFKRQIRNSLKVYMENDVLRPHTPYHGKYILPGPGIGSWGEWGDAGKFMTNALQAIWGYAEYSGDWQSIRNRWDLIKRFFITPEEADWISFGRYAIAEIGDEAAPCSAYARMAWSVGDPDEYLFGAYMFSRELIHLYVKQRAASYFFDHQPYNQYEPMPRRIYLTDLWGSTRGWQVDGPAWGHLSSGEHQSANRWMRFHDPDIGRFYRDYLEDDVRKELAWYAEAGRNGRTDVYGLKRYQEWLTRDNPNTMPSLLRLSSFLLDAPLEPLSPLDLLRYRTGWGAADIAVGYSALRLTAPRKYERLIPITTGPSPFVPGLQREERRAAVATVQDVRDLGLSLEPRWNGWDMPRNPDGGADGAWRSFGRIEGAFPGMVAGPEGIEWLSYGCSVNWANGVPERRLSDPNGILRQQDQTPVAAIGPFPNADDNELTSAVYPPEEGIDLGASYRGVDGPVSWKPMRLAAGRRLNLARELAGINSGGALAYVVQFVWAPEDMDVYLLARDQGGIVAWVNKSAVLSHHGPHRPSANDALRGLGHLRKGWNEVLLKVESFTGDYNFEFRLVGLDRQPIPALQFADQAKTVR